MTKQNHLADWPEMLWREWRFSADAAYRGRLYKLIAGLQLRAEEWQLKRQGRPYATQVEAAIRQACAARPKATYDWDKHLRRLERDRCSRTEIDVLLKRLETDHWPERFIAAHRLVDQGGDAVQALRMLVLTGPPASQTVGRWLLQSIGFATTTRLAAIADTLLCSNCYVYCHELEILLLDELLTHYYGCRDCGRTQPLQSNLKPITVVLDDRASQLQDETEQQLRVYWFGHSRPFDFEAIEIIRATNEEIERFAMRVGNDTDRLRQARYKSLPCRVSRACGLSENTLRVLEYTFGPLALSDDLG
jgi:hypothetical protein